MKYLERIKEDEKFGFKLVWTLIILVALIILGIRYWVLVDSDDDIRNNESIMECIAKNSTLYTSQTCGYCKEQKEILGEYIYIFNLIDCTGPEQSPTGYNECQMMRIISVPTWIINGKKYMGGVRKLKELKKLTGC